MRPIGRIYLANLSNQMTSNFRKPGSNNVVAVMTMFQEIDVFSFYWTTDTTKQKLH